MKKIDILNLSKYLRFPGDNKLARIGHVNSVITDVNNKIDAPANPVTGDALVYNGTDWVPGYPTDPTLQTAVVEISSAELGSGGPGKDLFTIPVGKRLTELSVLIINRAGSIAWSTIGGGSYLLIRSSNNGDVLININKELFSYWGANNETYINYVWGENGGTTTNTLGVFQEPIPNVIQYIVPGTEMATGNGTATFKIRYRLEDAL
jgi:hypothetical protein